MLKYLLGQSSGILDFELDGEQQVEAAPYWARYRSRIRDPRK